MFKMVNLFIKMAKYQVDSIIKTDNLFIRMVKYLVDSFNLINDVKFIIHIDHYFYLISF